MYVIRGDNVAEIFPQGIGYLLRAGKPKPSRAGQVLEAPVPVTTVYYRPQECVLLNPVRDANPFFHVAEALWILSGRRDAAFLNTYVKDFGERFAEAEGHIHGAYGDRLRVRFGLDQIAALLDKLRRDPSTRQGVLQLWDADLDLEGEFKDRPCNLTVLFSINEGRLNMTVYNRSNDMVMGAYGANAVHFSFLQQYVAGMLGVPMGLYFQVSNNFHLYTRDLDKLVARAGVDEREFQHALSTPYKGAPEPLVTHPASFDAELAFFMRRAESNDWEDFPSLQNEFLSLTAKPLLQAHAQFKAGDRIKARRTAVSVKATDWQEAAISWLMRRKA